MSPTQRSIAKLKAEGWPFVRVVEHWNVFARIRKDLWGADLIALRQNATLLVQTTSGPNVSARVNKLRDSYSAEIAAWLSIPQHVFEVHGWRRVGARGKRKTWQCRVVEILPNAAECYRLTE